MMTGQRVHLRLVLCVAMVLCGALTTSIAAPPSTGTGYTRTVTFADTSTATVGFDFPGSIFTPITTTLFLEFGSDGDDGGPPGGAPPLTASDLSGVQFQLTKAGVTKTFLFTELILDDSATFLNKRVQFNKEDPLSPALFYKIDITHQVTVSAVESWILAINNVPTAGSKRVRAQIYVQQGVVTSLSPAVAVSGGGPNVSVDVAASVSSSALTYTATVSNGTTSMAWQAVPEDYASGLTCTPLSGTALPAAGTSTLTVTCPLPVTLPCCEMATMRFDIKDSAATVLARSRKSVKLDGLCAGGGGPYHFPWDKYVRINWREFPWRPPHPGCLSCPIPWKQPIREGYERVVLYVMPLNDKGEFLGVGKSEALKVKGEFTEIGPWIEDAITNEYLKVVEYKIGTTPTITVSVEGHDSRAFPLTTSPLIVSSDAVVLSRTALATVAGVLLVGLLVFGWLVRRGKGNATPSQRS